MSKKVIILTPFYPPSLGGAETFAEELYEQAKKRFSAFVCKIHWRKIWRGIRFSDSVMVILRLMPKFLDMCLWVRPKTVHALGFTAAFIGAALKPIFRYKLIVTPLALYDFSNRLLYRLARWTLKRVDVVFAESELSRTNLAYVTNINKIKIFTHWVNTNKFFPVNRINDRLNVLFASRPIPEKGIDIIKAVEKDMKGVDFVYAQTFANKDMPKLFQMADVVVVPSLYAESPNRVVAEGAASGCVVIVSNRGALPEQVEDFGFVVEPTPAEFRKAIQELDNDRLWLQLIRDETIKYASEHLTERNAEGIFNEY